MFVRVFTRFLTLWHENNEKKRENHAKYDGGGSGGPQGGPRRPPGSPPRRLQKAPEGPRRLQKAPERPQKAPEGSRRPQKAPEDPRRLHKAPESPRKAPGNPRKPREAPGGPRRAPNCSFLNNALIEKGRQPGPGQSEPQIAHFLIRLVIAFFFVFLRAPPPKK